MIVKKTFGLALYTKQKHKKEKKKNTKNKKKEKVLFHNYYFDLQEGFYVILSVV